MTADDVAGAPASVEAAPAPVSTAPDQPDPVAALTQRVDALEASLAEQGRRLDRLLDELGA